MDAITDGDAEVVDVTSFVSNHQSDRAADIDVDYERQVALG
jgi:hypothetical protein